MPVLLYFEMSLLDFIVLKVILFAVHIKHTSFLPSAVVKPMSNDLVHAMHWQCLFALYVYAVVMVHLRLHVFIVIFTYEVSQILQKI
jgi:hypothetical protein